MAWKKLFRGQSMVRGPEGLNENIYYPFGVI